MGTSKGYIPPAKPEWSNAKRAVSGFLRNRDSDSRADAIQKFGEAMNSSAAVGSTSFASAAGNIMAFARDISKYGLEHGLANLGRSDLIGKSSDEILQELLYQFTNDSSSLEDSLAADSLSQALENLRVDSVEQLGSVDLDIGTGVLRAIGDSRMPLYVLIVCCLANVVLDLLFVVVFHWGVFGVAFATILSQLISAVLLMIRLMGTQEAYRVELRKIRFHKDILKNVVRIGLPAGLQSVMYSFSNILIQASINSFGTTAIAAWAAIGKIDGFIWMVMNAFGIAVTTFAGQNFGARQYDRMKRCTRVGLGMCLGTIIALSALLFVFRYQLLMFFTGDAEVVNIGAQFYLVLAPSYFTFVFIEILSGAIRGAGEALQPMLITCIGVCGLRVVWILLVVPYWHTMQMVAMNYPVSWVITAVIFVIYYLRGKWLDRCIRREHDPQHGTATEA